MHIFVSYYRNLIIFTFIYKFVYLLETRFCCLVSAALKLSTTQAGLELPASLLPQALECKNYSRVPPHPAIFTFLHIPSLVSVAYVCTDYLPVTPVFMYIYEVITVGGRESCS